MTGREREHRGVGVGGRDDPRVGWTHDGDPGDEIDEFTSLGIEHRDLVTVLEFVQVAEGLAVRRAMTGHREVAESTRLDRMRVVTRPFLQIVGFDAFDDVLLHTDARDAQDRDRLTRFDRDREFVIGRRVDRRRSGDGLLEAVLESILRLGLLDSGAPELVADEKEEEHAGGDQDLAGATEEPVPVPLRATRATRIGRCAHRRVTIALGLGR